MHCRALPIAALPHQPQLLRDYLHSYERVSAFFQHKPDLESILNVARALDFPADPPPRSSRNSSPAKSAS